ncbi:MAG: tetratricopeptide repeat protein, partial [Candidatus Alcyoniella australis]|nr:tetratricopeptide repeat protein [Candidatus Alcyoniella australis]
MAAAALPCLDVPRELHRLESIEMLLELNSELFWRQRPDLHAEFEGTQVCTDREGFRLDCRRQRSQAPDRNGQLRIVTLGASPTFGYGVEADQAYPSMARELLRESHQGLDVVNAGQIGYSSFQGIRLFEKYCATWSPALVTVSYMVNDIDRFRFFFSNGLDDKRALEVIPANVGASNALARFGPTGFLLNYRRRLLVKLGGQIDYRKRYELGTVRVPPRDYRANLERFVQAAEQRGVDLVFIKMPLRLPKPLPAANPATQSTLDSALEMIEKGDPQGALEMIERALDLDPHASRSYYLQGRALEALGRSDDASASYRLAVEHVIYDCARNSRQYNAIMQSLAEENGIALVDAAS